MNSAQLAELIEQVLKEGNFDIVEFPNLKNDAIDYSRFLEFADMLLEKLPKLREVE